MKIVYFSKYFYPHKGGVETHLFNIAREQSKKNCSVTVITSSNAKDKKKTFYKDIRILHISYPNIKYIGLLVIWFKLIKYYKIILTSDIVHIHDVFIWYLPIKIVFPFKKVFVTFHGWEGKYPISIMAIFQKKLSSLLSSGSISIGKYINKYYRIKTNRVLYGASNYRKSKINKTPKSIVFVGRLDHDTGLPLFLEYLQKNRQNFSNIIFLGDGPLRKKCTVYGTVKGFVDTRKYLTNSEFCVPGGYLSFLDAKKLDCKILTFHNNPLKRDYWNEIKNNYINIKDITWNDISKIYFDLWNSYP